MCSSCAVSRAARATTHTIRPLVAHEVEDLEELGEVQVLLGCDDVDHLVELVLLPAFDRAADVARDVQRRAVALLDDRLGELVLLEVDDERALVLGHELHLLQLGDGRLLARQRDLRLARVRVEVDVEPAVDLLRLGDRQRPELLPHRDRLRFLILHPPEEGARGGMRRAVLVGELLELGRQLGLAVVQPRVLRLGRVIARLEPLLPLRIHVSVDLLRCDPVDRHVDLVEVLVRIRDQLLPRAEPLEADGEQTCGVRGAARERAHRTACPNRRGS